MEFTVIPDLGSKVGVVVTFDRYELYGDDFAGELVRGVRAAVPGTPLYEGLGGGHGQEPSPLPEQTRQPDEAPEESPLGFGTLEDYEIIVQAARGAGIAIDEAELDAEAEANFNAWKSQMRYRAMATGGSPYANVDPDEARLRVREQTERELLVDRYLRQVIREEGIEVTREELEAEALAVAERQHTTLEMMRGFMGDDFGLLEGDLKRKKALALIVERSQG